MRSVRLAVRAFPALFAASLLLLPAGARAAGKAGIPNMFDARTGVTELRTALQANHVALRSATQRTSERNRMRAAAAELALRVPGARVQFSTHVGGPSEVVGRGASLTPPAPGADSRSIVMGFLAAHEDLYGLDAADLKDLVVLGDSPGGRSGLRMLRVEQQVDGIPVFQSETRFLLARDGRLMKSVGLLAPAARASAVALRADRTMPPQLAIVRLLASVGHTASEGAFTVGAATPVGLRVDENDDYVAGQITARQVLFPLGPHALVPAWSLVVSTTGDQDWYAVVDAASGAILWRKNIRDYASAQDARFRVYVQADGTTPADSPAPASPNAVAPGSNTQFDPIAPTIVSMHTAYDPVASQNGWIDDCPVGGCTANETQTLGNNVLACMDLTQGANANICDTSAAAVIDGNGRPTGNPDSNGRNRDFLGTAPRDFQTNFTPPPQSAANADVGQTCTGNGNNGTLAIDQFRRGAVTHLFYSLNWYHDQLFELGFDEASGNFQQTNFSGMGLGGDRVNADVDDGSGSNNANFSTPPDGTSGRMQMYRFTGPSVDRDGSLDAEVFLHEATHGTSNRLVGDAAGLNWDPAGGMGEGWSDFVALSLLNNSNADDPDGRYASGGYATYKLSGFPTYLDNYVYGIRRFPYSTDNSVNPMTWADVDDVTNDLSGGIPPDTSEGGAPFNANGGAEVHNIGEIWALTLWEVRSRVIADPAGANGDVPTGNHTMLQLVIDGLKMTPIDPNFTDARDAILDADCATNACANEDSIWGGFADRGLGYGAAEPYHQTLALRSSHIMVHESFSVPFLDVANGASDVTIDDSAANNNGAIDPGEAVKLTVKLTNPWRGASKAVANATATLSTSTSGVTIYDNSSTYGAIAPQGSASGDSFTITVDPSVPCGSAIDFTLTTVSSLGTTSTTFRLRVGTANGTDPVVTYTATPNQAIPDGQPRGVFNTLNITDDLEIADVDFRVDSLTHTFVDDLSIALRSPAGIGTDMAELIGLNTFDGGDGDNLTNFVMDDDVTADATHDMIQQDDSHSPGYTGTYVPVYNSPSFADPLFFGLPGDPVGLLSRYDGTSTKGTWSVLEADEFAIDTGTMNTWSLLVTPVHFDCAAFTPAVVITATKTVSGTFNVGGTVTYTVTLTNNGTANQADNAGHEFTDTLPAGLTLTGVTSVGTPAGTPSSSGNTANWDGSLAPLGGTVTITITATIDSGTGGQTISNQGTVSYDSDANGTNEATLATDDPSVGGASDPTSFTVAGLAAVGTHTKSVSGDFHEGGVVTYTLVLENNGTAPQNDNAGNELDDTVPSQLTVTDVSATSGTAAHVGNAVSWNGSIAAGGSVTITITAIVGSGTAGQTVSNQAHIHFDTNNDNTNDGDQVTDDPSTVNAADDPTSFVVVSLPIAEIPAVGGAGLMLLGLLLGGLGTLVLALRRG